MAAARVLTNAQKGEAVAATLLLHMHTSELLAGADLEQEYRFHPERRWRFDFAIPSIKLAMEIDGGNRIAVVSRGGKAVAVGRHTADADYEKLCEAAILGWRVLRFTPAQVKSGYAIGAIERAVT